MSKPMKILFAGESWMLHAIHVKGFDSFEISSYHEGATEMIAALRVGGIEVTYQPSHVAAEQFPFTREALDEFDAIVLSDIGANTLLMPERTAVRSIPSPNRLSVVADYVRSGGSLLMIGGYLTFQGIQGKGNYKDSPIEAVLPVVLQATDDRREEPQGLTPVIINAAHPIVAGLSDWPHFLGYNRATLHADAELVAEIGGDPFIAVRNVGKGRSAVFSSDCGPHWGPPAFTSWSGYGQLWINLVTWLAGSDEQASKA